MAWERSLTQNSTHATFTARSAKFTGEAHVYSAKPMLPREAPSLRAKPMFTARSAKFTGEAPSLRAKRQVYGRSPRLQREALSQLRIHYLSMPRPLFVYDNWSAYDELSDNSPLTEELAMRQLQEIVRLKAHGVQMDAYLMDAFWYDQSGGYLKWKADRWPNGPDGWLQACRENSLLPGLWFPANVAFQLDPPDDWLDSLAPGGYGFCCFEGGFLDGYLARLAHWYDQGVRVFKFDFAEFGAATSDGLKSFLPSEIRLRNETAFKTDSRISRRNVRKPFFAPITVSRKPNS